MVLPIPTVTAKDARNEGAVHADRSQSILAGVKASQVFLRDARRSNMAVAEIGNLATTFLNRLSGQDRNASANTPPAVNVHATNANVLPEDRFTPSAQQDSVQTAAQQAGLFQVAQFSTQ